MRFTGSLVALVTPMAADGDLDTRRLHHLLDWHLEAGTDGLVIGGTTGESPTLLPEELDLLVNLARDHVAGRMPLIVGTGSHSTAAAVERTLRAAVLGADAALVVTPYYNKPPQAGLVAHYRAIADASPIPLILYNVPGRTGVDLSVAAVEALADHPRIVGIKEAGGDVTRIRELVQAVGDRLTVLSGDDALLVPALRLGARGIISVTANVAPGLMKALCEAYTEDPQHPDVLSIESRLMPLHEALFVEANPIPVKWALSRLGLIQPWVRLPLVPLSDAARPVVQAALDALTAP